MSQSDDGPEIEVTDAADVDIALDGDAELADVTLDDAESARVTHVVPQPVRDAAQERTERGELSERVRDLYRIVATGGVTGSRDQLKLELERVRSKKDRLRGEIEDIQAQLHDLERREQRLEERVDQHQSRKDRYLGHLESLEQRIHAGQAAPPEHGAVEQAADIAGKTPEAVIEDIRERNPGLPDRAFVRQDTLAPHEQWRGTAGGGDPAP